MQLRNIKARALRRRAVMHKASSPSSSTVASRTKFTVQLVLARLRFVFIVLATLLVLVTWQSLRQLGDWVAARANFSGPQDPTVSPDTEYFCPMCPGVLSAWPEKCPVCKMPLVRRLRGEAGILPEGVVARMQLSPYRLQLAGIRTAPVRYEPLERTWHSIGRIVRDGEAMRTSCDVRAEDAPFIHDGQTVVVRSSRDKIQILGTVREIQQAKRSSGFSFLAQIELSGDATPFPPGAIVEVHWTIPLAECEPYRSMPRNMPTLQDSDAREVFVCDEHPTYLHTAAGKCPFHDVDLHPQALADSERLEWVCPAHPETRVATASNCAQCQDLPCVPQIIRYAPPGHVLSVPESAVIDSGDHQWVFVESGHGMFDAVEVTVGARSGDAVPLLSGVHAGQRVVASGTFLLDAETRLNPNLATAYFGAAQANPTAMETVVRKTSNDTDSLAVSAEKLPISDYARIRRQRVCPITKFPLGSMGTPPRYRVGEHVVYLCCAGCRGRLRGATELPISATPIPSIPAAVPKNSGNVTPDHDVRSQEPLIPATPAVEGGS
jgi:hypothetical protein